VICDEARDLLAAYSLDSLEVDERDELEEHLATCQSCAAEQLAYQEAAGALALGFAQHEPPRDLKQRVLVAARLGSRERARPWWTRVRMVRPQLQAASVAAGLALVVALSTTLWAAGLQMQLNEQRTLAANLRERATRYDKVVSVLQAADIQLRPMQGTQLAPAAVGRLYVDPETGDGMMMVRSLPPLAEGRAYQLWWLRADGKRESGGLLTWTDRQGNGYTSVQCPGPFRAWQWVGLTEEPAGGSVTPTGQRLLSGTI